MQCKQAKLKCKNDPTIYTEWVIVESEKEFEEAKIYLALWMQFLLKKFTGKRIEYARVEKNENVWGEGKHEVVMRLKLKNI